MVIPIFLKEHLLFAFSEFVGNGQAVVALELFWLFLMLFPPF